MRSDQEFIDTILSFAQNSDLIKVVGMEGSRIHPLIKPDALQDFDITFVVTDKQAFKKDDSWLDMFGERIFLQKPESMTLYAPQLGNWEAYLMLFEDGKRMDLTIVPLEELDVYLSSESLIKILMDKDQLVGDFPLPTNTSYHIQEPIGAYFDDCCNEFWWIATYVVKGIYREEMPYAANYLNRNLREELYRMLSWKVGFETNFAVSIGKHYRFLEKYVSKDLWERILKTYNLNSYEETWESLFDIMQLFREVSKEVADHLAYPYPDYDENITKYIEGLYAKYKESK